MALVMYHSQVLMPVVARVSINVMALEVFAVERLAAELAESAGVLVARQPVLAVDGVAVALSVREERQPIGLGGHVLETVARAIGARMADFAA
jgi:hypothetical protein